MLWSEKCGWESHWAEVWSHWKQMLHMELLYEKKGSVSLANFWKRDFVQRSLLKVCVRHAKHCLWMFSMAYIQQQCLNPLDPVPNRRQAEKWLVLIRTQCSTPYWLFCVCAEAALWTPSRMALAKMLGTFGHEALRVLWGSNQNSSKVSV